MRRSYSTESLDHNIALKIMFAGLKAKLDSTHALGAERLVEAAHKFSQGKRRLSDRGGKSFAAVDDSEPHLVCHVLEGTENQLFGEGCRNGELCPWEQPALCRGSYKLKREVRGRVLLNDGKSGGQGCGLDFERALYLISRLSTYVLKPGQASSV